MPTRQLFLSLSNFYRPFINAVNGQLAKYDLSNSQWVIMRLLKQQAPLTFQEIAKANYIEKPSASSLIHKLISRGYAETVDGKDKRTKLVRLTIKGEQIYEEVDTLLDAWLATLVEGIPEDNQGIVAETLDSIKKNVNSGV